MILYLKPYVTPPVECVVVLHSFRLIQRRGLVTFTPVSVGISLLHFTSRLRFLRTNGRPLSPPYLMTFSETTTLFTSHGYGCLWFSPPSSDYYYYFIDGSCDNPLDFK